MNTKLTDKFNRPIQDLRISVIDRCNFRCPYCMPEEEYSKNYSFLKEKDWLSFDEITRLVQIFVGLGVKKVRLTGGEPLLRPNLVELVNELAQIQEIEDLALTTNGQLLSEWLSQSARSKLRRLTVSLDAVDSRTFGKMSGGRGSVAKVLKGIQDAKKAGFKDIKINVVVQRGVNDHKVLDIVEYFRGSDTVVRFIEYMDVGTCNHWEKKYVVPSKEIRDSINQVYPLEPVDPNYFGEVAKRYRYRDGKGEIGFISSITQPFCQSCTRARITTNGHFMTCLFASKGEDLQYYLRNNFSDDEIKRVIQNVWQKREDRYSELRPQFIEENLTPNKKEMFHIGG